MWDRTNTALAATLDMVMGDAGSQLPPASPVALQLLHLVGHPAAPLLQRPQRQQLPRLLVQPQASFSDVVRKHRIALTSRRRSVNIQAVSTSSTCVRATMQLMAGQCGCAIRDISTRCFAGAVPSFGTGVPVQKGVTCDAQMGMVSCTLVSCAPKSAGAPASGVGNAM